MPYSVQEIVGNGGGRQTGGQAGRTAGGTVQQYLPFALRELIVAEATLTPGGLPLPTNTVIRVSSSEIGFERPVHLGDISVTAIAAEAQTVPEADSILMRIGWRGRGYILERPIQLGAWINKGRALYNCWRLEKPYYLPKSGVLQVLIQPYDNVNHFRGILFNCTREDNGEPYYLYDSTEEAIGADGDNMPIGLRKQHLKAPPETGLFVHSVEVPEYDVTGISLAQTGVRIIGPNGYEWLRVVDRSNVAALVPAYHQQWLGTPTSMIELGSERGWIIQPKQALLVEIENRSAVDIYTAVTIRGSVEV